MCSSISDSAHCALTVSDAWREKMHLRHAVYHICTTDHEVPNTEL